MSVVLSAHTLEIAAIAVPYFGLMIVLGGYMAGQARVPRRDDEETRHLEEWDLVA